MSSLESSGRGSVRAGAALPHSAFESALRDELYVLRASYRRLELQQQDLQRSLAAGRLAVARQPAVRDLIAQAGGAERASVCERVQGPV